MSAYYDQKSERGLAWDDHDLAIPSPVFADAILTENHQRYRFEQVDICSAPELARIFARYRPTAVVHLAAETHVDRSIDDPVKFIETNVLGTGKLLHAAHDHSRGLAPAGEGRTELAKTNRGASHRGSRTKGQAALPNSTRDRRLETECERS